MLLARRKSLVKKKKKTHPGQVDGFAIMTYMPNMLSAHCNIGLGQFIEFSQFIHNAFVATIKRSNIVNTVMNLMHFYLASDVNSIWVGKLN